jgi:hypothetical protein
VESLVTIVVMLLRCVDGSLMLGDRIIDVGGEIQIEGAEVQPGSLGRR